MRKHVKLGDYKAASDINSLLTRVFFHRLSKNDGGGNSMFKRILVTTDASEYSRRALSTAIGIAKQFQSEIELVHVIATPYPLYGDIISGTTAFLSKEQVQMLGNRVFEATLTGLDTGQVKIHKKIRQGLPAPSILAEIKRDFDLVVIGSRGYGPVAGIFVGSVTQRVLADCPCPVLVVK